MRQGKFFVETIPISAPTYFLQHHSPAPHRESKVPKWELGGRIFQMNSNIFFENISDNGT